MPEDELFLKFYLNVAYQLALWDILNSISDLQNFLTSLKVRRCITEAEYVDINGLTKSRRKWNLLKVLLSKNTDWKEIGFLDALNDADKKASDCAVLRVLDVFNGILDRLLVSDDKTVEKWGPLLTQLDVEPWLDNHCKRLAFQLTLPDIVASAPNLEQFCRTLRSIDVVTAAEWRELMRADINGVAVRLGNKDPGEVLAALPAGEKHQQAENGMARAYGLAVTTITGKVPVKRDLKKYAAIGLASLGVGVAGALLAPVALAAVGFGSGGIVAGSAAAWFMSTYAGAVPARSLCALLQSAGAAGIAASTSAGIAAGSGGVTFGALSGLASFIKRQKYKKLRDFFSN